MARMPTGFANPKPASASESPTQDYPRNPYPRLTKASRNVQRTRPPSSPRGVPPGRKSGR